MSRQPLTDHAISTLAELVLLDISSHRRTELRPFLDAVLSHFDIFDIFDSVDVGETPPFHSFHARWRNKLEHDY